MKKNRCKRLCRGIGLVVILAILAMLILRFMFVVRNVEVVGGTANYSKDALVRLANVGFGESIFRVDAEKVEARLNATGALRMEKMRLRYPDTVEITVAERKRAAMLLHMGKIRVLDENGYVVESLPQVPNEDLIYVSGMRVQGYALGEAIRADEDQMEAYRTLIPVIRQQDAQMYISEIKLDDVENIMIITRTGVNVQIGKPENMQSKIAWMKGAIADLERRGESGGTLDVRSGTKADYRQGT